MFPDNCQHLNHTQVAKQLGLEVGKSKGDGPQLAVEKGGSGGKGAKGGGKGGKGSKGSRPGTGNKRGREDDELLPSLCSAPCLDPIKVRGRAHGSWRMGVPECERILPALTPFTDRNPDCKTEASCLHTHDCGCARKTGLLPYWTRAEVPRGLRAGHAEAGSQRVSGRRSDAIRHQRPQWRRQQRTGRPDRRLAEP